MDAKLVREYRARWQAVTDVEDAEQREATLAERWQRLNAILQMAQALGLDLETDREDVVVVRERWVRLKAGPPGDEISGLTQRRPINEANSPPHLRLSP